MQNRYFSLIIAALLPLLIFGWFAQSFSGQVDFWLLWLVAMLGVGLPLLFAEVGLAHRSGAIPALGMQTLTREADTSILWRSFSWLTAFGAVLLAALSIDRISAGLLQAASELGTSIDIPVFALGAGMVIITTILSLLGRVTAPVGLGFLLLFMVFGVFTGMTPVDFQITQISLVEWARAVVLALVTVGVGTGLYWFHAQNIAPVRFKPSLKAPITAQPSNPKTKLSASKTVLPIWLIQLIAGSSAFLLTSMSIKPLAYIIYTLAVMMIAAYLLYYASSQFAVKLGTWAALLVTMLATLALVVIATPQIMLVILTLLSLVCALILAIFAGWQMKISHMRKSLNFSSEVIYNIWRIAVRILAPLMIIAAIIGWVLHWVG